MMPWIESHTTLARHPKTLRLARRLNVSLPTAIGHLHLLWWWALEYTMAGDLAEYDDDEIAAACAWEGEPAAMREALRAAGFLDEGDALHDWDDYAGKLLDQRKANAEKQQRWRDRHKPSIDEGSNRHVTVTETVTSPIRNGATVPNRTQPTSSPTEKTGPDAEAPVAVQSALKFAKPKSAPTTRAVQEANKHLHKRCDEAEREAINETVTDGDAVAADLWIVCLKSWRLKYPNNRGLDGPLDWFRSGGPPPPGRPMAYGTNGAVRSGQYQQPQSVQRNPGPAPPKEPTPEEEARSAAERERVKQELAKRKLAGKYASIGRPS